MSLLGCTMYIEGETQISVIPLFPLLLDIGTRKLNISR